MQLIQCENWALLVAGSNGYYNYRHQADICHAYHILRKHGVPEENIVTMMYDDIAYNEANPIQGNVINQPNGPNVYPGVVIDYKKKDVTPEVFLAVMSGNEEKVKELTGHTGKVLKSGPDDHVFVNFADHGAPGLLAFPEGTLPARQLMSTIKSMYQKKAYKKLVLYVEACESGSMFYDLLPQNINVYASTAANRSQSSYACYYDEKRQTYLGDVYSVNWMEDSDQEDLETETIHHQFVVVKGETNTSQVRQFGDQTISQMTVAEFQGDEKDLSGYAPNVPFVHPSLDAVPAREAQLHMLVKRLNNPNTTRQEKIEIVSELRQLLELQQRVDKLFQTIVDLLLRDLEAVHGKGNVLRFYPSGGYQSVKEGRADITQWVCYENAVDTLAEKCPGMKLSQNYHALGQLYMLINLCERGHNSAALTQAIAQASLSNPKLLLTGVAAVGAVTFFITRRKKRNSNRLLSALDNVDLTGKTAIVTGANTGIGFWTAQELAKRHAKVILACRSLQRAEEARDSIIAATGNHDVGIGLLDLRDFSSVWQFVDEFKKTNEQLDILVNNAGVYVGSAEFPRVKQGLTPGVAEKGLDVTMTINHLGPYLLTRLLIDVLSSSRPSRIINVSSAAQRRVTSSFDFEALQGEKLMSAFQAYSLSKLANLLFTRSLAEKFESKGIRSYCVHPGAVSTEIWRNLKSLQMFLVRIFFFFSMKTPEKGAETLIYACLAPGSALQSGKYYVDCGLAEDQVSPLANDGALGDRLWDVSASLVGLPPQQEEQAVLTEPGTL
ncbi:hypothetical protein ACOMHN_044565 [Nucella lapillus]